MARRRGSISVTVEGTKDIVKALQNMSDTLNDEALLEAAVAGAEIVRTDASLRAPRSQGAGSYPDGGHAADHIITKTSEKPGEVSARVGPDKNAFYINFYETGTSKVRARPFLRPALDENKDKILEAMAAVFRKHLRRVVK
jgi:HK97 gp10 family phage protein